MSTESGTAWNRVSLRISLCEPGAVTNAIGYAKFFSRSHNAVIRVYDKLQFAVTNRRSGRYGNTSRIWPSRSFRCTLRQKSG
jgi:hypothetical protein